MHYSSQTGGGNGGVVNGGMVGNAVKPGVMNGLVLNGQPFLAQVRIQCGWLKSVPALQHRLKKKQSEYNYTISGIFQKYNLYI